MDARSGVGGETALAAAAGAGQAQAVRWLLRHGADAALQDDRHASPLDKARAGGHAACAQARARAEAQRLLREPVLRANSCAATSCDASWCSCGGLAAIPALAPRALRVCPRTCPDTLHIRGAARALA